MILTKGCSKNGAGSIDNVDFSLPNPSILQRDQFT